MATIESSVDRTVSKLEVQLEQWAAKLDEVVASAEQAGEQAKRDSRERLDELKAQLAAARARLDEAKTAGADKWDTMKQGLERSWKELERTFQRLVHGCAQGARRRRTSGSVRAVRLPTCLPRRLRSHRSPLASPVPAGT